MANGRQRHSLYITSSYPSETYIKDGDTTNPIIVNGSEITVTPGDYIKVKNHTVEDPVVREYDSSIYTLTSVWYVYTVNNSWKYAGYNLVTSRNPHDDDNNDKIFSYGVNLYNTSSYCEHSLGTSNIIGSTLNEITSTATNSRTTITITDYTPNYHTYGGSIGGTDRTVNSPITTEAQFGDYAQFSYEHSYLLDAYYQYPGIWVRRDNYPDLTIDIPIIAVKPHVALKWQDPGDITTYEPTPATWKGTIVIRKEDSAPKHRWDGEEIVRTTTSNKDAYAETAYKDEDIQLGKTYYYGFFPYYKKTEIDGHNINFFRFTKVIKVETGVNADAPEITNIMAGTPQDWDGSEVAFAWSGSNKITVAVASNTITFKMYIGDSVIYTFNAASGSTIDDVKDISLAFLIDKSSGVAKPSLVYESNDTYSYNQESPTDSEMRYIYTWLTNGDIVPPEYRSYINNINKDGFWWKGYPNKCADDMSKAGLVYYPCNSVSWFTKPNPLMNMTFSEATTDQRMRDVYCSDILDLYITLENNVYSFNLTIPSTDMYWQFNEGVGSRVAKAGNVWTTYVAFSIMYYGDSSTFTFSYSNSDLSEVLSYIQNRFKNVNLYVDGILWYSAGN